MSAQLNNCSCLLYSLIIFSVSTYSVQGNCTTQRDFQTWSNLTVTGNFNREKSSKFNYWLEVQERVGNNSARFSQTLLRTGLGYNWIPKLSIWVGYTYVYTSIPFTSKPFSEDRAWEQLLYIKKTAYSTLTSRLRIEQRFVVNNKIAYRARQLLKLSKPIKPYSNFSLVGSDELFWHKNNFVGKNAQGFDQNRFFMGIGYKVNSNITTELGYMNQYIRRFGAPNFLNNVFAMNFYINY